MNSCNIALNVACMSCVDYPNSCSGLPAGQSVAGCITAESDSLYHSDMIPEYASDRKFEIDRSIQGPAKRTARALEHSSGRGLAQRQTAIAVDGAEPTDGSATAFADDGASPPQAPVAAILSILKGERNPRTFSAKILYGVLFGDPDLKNIFVNRYGANELRRVISDAIKPETAEGCYV